MQKNWLAMMALVTASWAHAACIDASRPLSVEEQRLANTVVPGGEAFSAQILRASGFDQYGPAFASALCQQPSFAAADQFIRHSGIALWQAALDRVQGRAVRGDLPHGDDRMLYWSRLQLTAAVRQWQPGFKLSEAQRGQLLWTLERASRGQFSIQFPSGAQYRRIIVSGFDPFTLGKPGSADAHVRIGNPSGALALALNGRQITLSDGSIAVIQTYLLPVNYQPFRQGMQEHTLLPFMRGPNAVQASITVSQGGKGEFWIEQWHGRYHATHFADNLGEIIPPLLAHQGDSDIYPPSDVLGYNAKPWQQNQPPQWLGTSLPVAAMINAHTGAGIANPYAGGFEGFPVLWHTSFSAFADCNANTITHFNEKQGGPYPPVNAPAIPAPDSCAQSGGGGNYLSNESGYRNVLLREIHNPKMRAGHLHVPVMTVFDPQDSSAMTDAIFEQYRDSVVLQSTRLIEAIAQSLVKPAL
ncbi:hypothetical protein [Amantichitinum ursilacus]|uniref:Pyrrolidone-carboxylate peptidase n=1 Tax=Amantichitinum ursilacus TaxID=857265 RepID=A0A0N1JTU4_9NEIS|nr:hypothetical protein [Amantichitinum ursilacus]KPC55172.1 hypothetical protein WG78_00900 [Amantichitinum ursilacus]